MADYDRKPTIIGRDADAPDRADLIGQLVQASVRDGPHAGIAVPLECEDLDIVFEREDWRGTRH